MPVKVNPYSGKGTFYQRVDQALYEEVKKENGGKLPANLTDSHGEPRKLTMSPADRAYRKKWQAIAAEKRKSQAVPKKEVRSPCVPCALKAEAAKIPPILLPSKKTGKPARLQLDPPSQSQTEGKHQSQRKVPCKHETLTVKCEHSGERAFDIQLPPTDGEEEGCATLEVIDNGKEKITCGTKIVAGACSSIHQSKVFDIYPDDTVEQKSDSELVFRAAHDADFDRSSFWELFHPSKARTPQQYNIRTQTCQQERSLSATVLVYPQLDWDIGVTVGVQAQRKISEYAEDVYTFDDSSKISVTGSVALTVCGKKREFGNEFSKGLKQNLKWATLAFDTADFLIDVAAKTGTVQLSFTYPTFSLKGKWGWQEIEDSPKCGYGAKWEIGFSPLVGAAVQVDVLDLLIDAAPFGPALVRIKHALEKGARMGILFRIDGRVDGNFTYNKIKTQSVGDAAGNLGGKVIFTLEGILQSKKFGFFCIHAGGEAKVAAHASFSGKITAGSDGDGAYYKGSLGFDGLLVYALVAGSATISLRDLPAEEAEDFEPDKTDIEDASPTQIGSETKKDEKGLARSIKYQKTWIWIDKHPILGGDEKHYFFEEGD